MAADTGWAVTSGGTTVDAENPWPGLEAFREADAKLFRGRQGLSTELAGLIGDQRLVVLYGRSGLGKTSLLRAGVFPFLRKARFLPVYVRVDFRALGDPLDLATLRSQVKGAIEAAANPVRGADDEAVDVPALDPAATLWEWFYRTDAGFWNARSRRVYPVLVFDQFEEAFTHGRRTDAIAALTAELLREVVDLVRGSMPPSVAARCERDASHALAYSTEKDVCHVVLSLRKEYLPELLRLKPQLPTLLDHRLELRGMTHSEAEEVVVGPNPALIEPGVEKLIVGFVSQAKRSVADESVDEAMVDPAILSVFCRELNRRRPAGARITADLVKGQQDTIISEFYAENVRHLGEQVEAFIEDELITETGYRNSVAREQALLAPGVTAEALDELTNRRLVRVEGSGPEARIELTHDVLAEPIMSRRDLRRQRTRQEAERQEAERLHQIEQDAAAQAQIERERRRELEFTRLELTAAQLKTEAAIRAAEAAASLRRANIHQRWLMGALALAVVAVGVLAYRNFLARNEAQANLATAYVEQAQGLVAADRRDQAAALLAQALRESPNHGPARLQALSTVLDVDWPLPVARLDLGGPAVWAEFDAPSSTLLTVSGTRVRFWAVPGGTERGSGLEHGASVATARFVGDGTRVLTLADGVARLWRASTGEEIARYTHPNSRVSSVSWASPPPGSSEAERVVTGGLDGSVRIWTGDEAREIRAHGAVVAAAELSPDGTRLVTAASDGSARLWDWRRGRRLAVMPHGEGEADMAFARFSPDGLLIATVAASSSKVRLWDAADGGPRFTLEPRHQVHAVAFDPDSTRLVTACEDGVARVWNTTNGREETTETPRKHDGPVTTSLFDTTGTQVVTASGDVVGVWDVARKGRSLERLAHAGTAVRSVALSSDQRYLVTTAGEWVWLWDVRPGSAIADTLWPPSQPIELRTAPGGDYVVGLGDGSWLVWDGRGASSPVFDGRRGSDWAPGERGQGVLLDAAEGGVAVRRADQSMGPTIAVDGVRRARFADGGRLIVTELASGTTRLWHTDTGAPVGPSVDTGSATVTVSDDGAYALAVDQDRDRSWISKTSTGEVVAETRPPDALAGPWTCDGRSLALLARGNARTVLDLESRAVLAIIAEALDAVTLSPDGRALVGLRSNGELGFYDLSTGRLAATGDVGGRLTALAFSRDGRRLAAGASSGRITVWDGRSWRPLWSTRGDGDPPTALTFAPDGRRVVAISRAVRAWDVAELEEDHAEQVAALLEALGGYRVGSNRVLGRVADRLAQLAEARRELGALSGTGVSARVARWALADRESRTIGPLSNRTIDEFVDAVSASWEGSDEVRRQFPWHASRPATPVGR